MLLSRFADETLRSKEMFHFKLYRLHKIKETGVDLAVKTSEVFLCFVAFVRVRFIMLTSSFSLFHATAECYRLLCFPAVLSAILHTYINFIHKHT